MKDIINSKYLTVLWYDFNNWDFTVLSNSAVIIDVGRLQIRIGR